MKTGSFTVAEIHEILLRHLDGAWQELRACHEDPNHLNTESRAYKHARKRFVDAEDALWAFKMAFVSVVLDETEQP